MDDLFTSLNPYDSLQAVYANSPEELCKNLRAIKTPIKVLSFVQVGARSYAYIMGDIRIKKVKSKEKTNGDSNS